MELVIGRIAKAHGVHGELVVEVRTDEPEARFVVGAVLTARALRERSTKSFVVRGVREHSGRLLLTVDGVTDRTEADALRGWLFVIDSAALTSPEDPDEFYDHELEGMAVRLADGTEIGKVKEVLHTGAGELLSVKAPDGREILIPFVAAIVTSVTRADGMVVDPPEGLLDL
ncbi:MAG: ribosome maturation factor RimM [Nocardiaceae bacterium]|nr:ribosome maturation factor RimM [Nocardiaceae bacterium]